MEGAERIMIQRENIDENILVSLNKRNENWQIVEDIKNDLATQKEDYANYQNDNNLKIAAVEKSLNDYKSTMANVNVNQEVKQSASGYGVVSLPKNAANGQVSVSVKGLTATNLVKNGNFANGTTNWSVFSANAPVVANNIASFTPTGQYGRLTQPFTTITGHKYFYMSKVKSDSDKVRIAIGADYPVKHTGSNNFEILSGIFSETSGRTTDIRIIDIRTSSWTQIQASEFKVIDLTTTFGAGNEPTKEQCDQMFPNYFEDTKSTISASRLKSVNKDGTQESVMYLPNVGELRSLPNGTKDEIRVNPSTGQYEHVKRNNEYVIKVDENLTYASLTNVDVYRVSLSDNEPFITDDTMKLTVEGKQLVKFIDRDNVDNIGKYYTTSGGNSNKVFFVFAKGTTLAQAREQLAGLTLTYQLAEPIITPIEVSGTLLSNPSGTIYVENVAADAGIYTDKMSVLHSNLPINYIEKLSKVDFNTGVETELDASKCVVAEDKLSFTHPDLVDNDIVFFTYFYDKESTLGETTIEYYDSRHTLKDSVTGKFYKVVPTVADGVLTHQLVEV